MERYKCMRVKKGCGTLHNDGEKEEHCILIYTLYTSNHLSSLTIVSHCCHGNLCSFSVFLFSMKKSTKKQMGCLYSNSVYTCELDVDCQFVLT